MPRGPKNAGADERRYEHKIPSRDEILAAMEQAGQPLTLEALAPGFGIRTEQHRRALEARMRAMVRDGQLLRNRADEYCLTGHLDVVTGKVLAHRDGFGFLRPDDGSDDLYLAAREMQLLVGRRSHRRARQRHGRGAAKAMSSRFSRAARRASSGTFAASAASTSCSRAANRGPRC